MSEIDAFLLTPAETAKALKMSKTKLYGLWKYRPEKAPPWIKIDANRYVTVDDLKEFLKSYPRGDDRIN